MKCIDEVPEEKLRGKRVFFRTSLNLPVDSKGKVTDLFRLKRALPTLEYLSKNGAKIIIAGYFGRKGETIRPVAEALQTLVPHIPVRFFGTSIEHAQAEGALLKEGECLMLENLRQESGEEDNDLEFTRLLASLADIFVSDALAEAHRNYASNVGIAALLPSYAGFLMREEVKYLQAALKPENPSFAILGGAKFETKAPLVKLLLKTYDHLFIAGALANDVFKARGLSTGLSLISKELPDQSILTNPHFMAPVDVTAEQSDGQAKVKKPELVEDDEKIVDIGPDSVAAIASYIDGAKFILWNGPTGMYEKGYITYTEQIARIVSQAFERGAMVVIGGGDTIAAIEAGGIPQEKLGFLSTGGGAMLQYLLKGTLPGIEVLK